MQLHAAKIASIMILVSASGCVGVEYPDVQGEASAHRTYAREEYEVRLTVYSDVRFRMLWFLGESDAFITELMTRAPHIRARHLMVSTIDPFTKCPKDADTGENGVVVRIPSVHLRGNRAACLLTLYGGPTGYESHQIDLERLGRQWRVIRRRPLGGVAKKEPNKALEPTTTAGTSAAKPPRAPAAVVAHL
jgi:hypothetical protein